MTIAGYDQHHHHHQHGGSAAFLPGTRSRQVRTMLAAGLLLILIWTIKQSSLIQDHVSD